MDVSETELKGQKSGPRLGKSTIAEDPLTRLWEKADASQGHHIEAVAQLLRAAGPAFSGFEPRDFKRIASARSLYHWNADANQEY